MFRKRFLKLPKNRLGTFPRLCVSSYFVKEIVQPKYANPEKSEPICHMELLLSFLLLQLEAY